MSWTALWRLAWRRLWWQARAGEYRLLLVALLLATASTTGVERLAHRVTGVIEGQARTLVGADLALRATEPIRQAHIDTAQGHGLATARTAQMRTMLAHDGRFVLADLKAVAATWPLRGQVTLQPWSLPAAATEAASDAAAHGNEALNRAPRPGELWLDPALVERLGVAPGERVRIGRQDFLLAGLIVHEPDRGSDFLGLAPRALIAWDDLAATGLIAPGSRVQYRLLVAGRPQAVAAWSATTATDLTPHERFIDIEDEQGGVRETVERARRFLTLASLTVVLVSGVAVALAAERLARRQRLHVALLRAWGADLRTTATLVGLESAWLGAFAATLGVLLGGAVEQIIAWLLAGATLGAAPLPLMTGAARGFAVALLTLFAFAGPPLLALAREPPIRVLRPGRAHVGLSAHLPLAALGLALILLPWEPAAREISGWLLAGLTGLVLAQAVVGFAFVHLAGKLRVAAAGPLRQGLASLARRRGQAVLQMVAVASGLCLVLVLTLVQHELMAGWGQRLAAGTPNHFLINILPEEATAVRDQLRAAGVAEVELHPMIRGRLTEIDGRPLVPGALPTARARHLAEREFNLSIATQPQPDNRIVAGQFWPHSGAQPKQFSVERDVALALGYGLGDRLRFSVGGEPVEATVTSLREVQWDSFNVNFFVVAPPGLLEGLPHTFVTSFHLPQGDEQSLLRRLVEAHPSLTVIDIRAQLAVLEGLIDRAAQGLSGVFALSLAAAALVLFAALAGSHDERRREAALLLALGASRARLTASLAAEFATLGLLSGLIAACAAAAIGVVLASEVFGLAYLPGPGLFLLGPLLGMVGVLAIGLAGTRDVVHTPPARVLAAEAG